MRDALLRALGYTVWLAVFIAVAFALTQLTGC
jgi:hypothetical protein